MSKRSKYTKEQKYATLKGIEFGELSIEDYCKQNHSLALFHCVNRSGLY